MHKNGKLNCEISLHFFHTLFLDLAKTLQGGVYFYDFVQALQAERPPFDDIPALIDGMIDHHVNAVQVHYGQPMTFQMKP